MRRDSLLRIPVPVSTTTKANCQEANGASARASVTHSKPAEHPAQVPMNTFPKLETIMTIPYSTEIAMEKLDEKFPRKI